MIKKLPDLNTPRHIFLEWTETKDGDEITETALARTFTSAPSVSGLRVYVNTECSNLDAISAAQDDVAGLRQKVKEVTGEIYSVVMFYYGVPLTPFVMGQVNDKVKRAMAAFEDATSNVFCVLGRLTAHTELLANISHPLQKYWGILSVLVGRVRVHVQRYAEVMESVVWPVVPFDAVVQQLLHPGEAERPSQMHDSFRDGLVLKLRDLKKEVRALGKVLATIQGEEEARVQGKRQMTADQFDRVEILVVSIESLKQSEQEMFMLFTSFDEETQSKFAKTQPNLFTRTHDYAWGWFLNGKKALVNQRQFDLKKSLLCFTNQIMICLKAYKKMLSVPPPARPKPQTQAPPPKAEDPVFAYPQQSYGYPMVDAEPAPYYQTPLYGHVTESGSQKPFYGVPAEPVGFQYYGPGPSAYPYPEPQEYEQSPTYQPPAPEKKPTPEFSVPLL